LLRPSTRMHPGGTAPGLDPRGLAGTRCAPGDPSARSSHHHRATAGWSCRFVPLPTRSSRSMSCRPPLRPQRRRSHDERLPGTQPAGSRVRSRTRWWVDHQRHPEPPATTTAGWCCVHRAMGRRRLQVRVLVGCSGQKRVRHCPRDRAESFQRAPRSRRLHHPLPTSGLAADYRDGHRTDRGVHDVIEPAHGGGVHVLLPAEWSTSAPARGAGV
jgi:hypothetical protein